MLGTPKAVSALLSGEMKDTAQLNAFALYGLEKFYSKKERATILRSFPGLASMLPKGTKKLVFYFNLVKAAIRSGGTLLG
jgi:phospholipid:diacylglycerol acyltransferase